MSNCSSLNNSLRDKNLRNDLVRRESNKISSEKDNTFDSINFRNNSEMNSPMMMGIRGSVGMRSRADSSKSIRTLSSQGKYIYKYSFLLFLKLSLVSFFIFSIFKIITLN